MLFTVCNLECCHGNRVAITTYLSVVSSSPPIRLSNDFVLLSTPFVIHHFVCNHGNTSTLLY